MLPPFGRQDAPSTSGMDAWHHPVGISSVLLIRNNQSDCGDQPDDRHGIPGARAGAGRQHRPERLVHARLQHCGLKVGTPRCGVRSSQRDDPATASRLTKSRPGRETVPAFLFLGREKKGAADGNRNPCHAGCKPPGGLLKQTPEAKD